MCNLAPILMEDPYRAPATPVHSEPPLKRLPLVWNPVTWLLLTAMLVAMEAAWFAYVGEEWPGHTNQMWGFFFAALSASWVYRIGGLAEWPCLTSSRPS